MLSTIPNAQRRSSRLLSCSVLAGSLGLSAFACSGEKEVTQSANAAIAIETGQFSVTIENRAGLALVNLTATIVPAAGPSFTHLISRLEGSEKRELSLNQFSSRDGTTFNLRVIRPKSVRVTGTDLTDKKYDIAVPWK
jgi:hypothetical protein